MPAIAAVMQPSAQEAPLTTDGLDAVEPGEVAVVDDGAHRDAGAGAVEQRPQQRAR